MWLDAIPEVINDIHTPEVRFIINAESGCTDRINRTGRICAEHYKTYHVNYLVLKAIHLAIKKYSNLWKGWKHIRINKNKNVIIHQKLRM